MENFLDKLELTDEMKEKIEAGMKEHNIYFSTLENSEIRYNKLKEKCNKQEEQLKEFSSMEQSFKELLENQERFSDKELSLQEELDNLRKDYEQRLLLSKAENHINSLLSGVDQKYLKMLKSIISLDELKDDDFSSIDLQIEDIKKDYPEMFNLDFSSKKSFKGTSKSSSISKEDFQKMTYKERMKLFNENKELYDKLK